MDADDLEVVDASVEISGSGDADLHVTGTLRVDISGSGSVTQVPQALLDQVKAGGRLLAIVGREPVMQATAFLKSAQGQFTQQVLFDTSATPLDHMAADVGFTF